MKAHASGGPIDATCAGACRRAGRILPAVTRPRKRREAGGRGFTAAERTKPAMTGRTA